MSTSPARSRILPAVAATAILTSLGLSAGSAAAAPDAGFPSVTAGARHSCAIKADRSVVCFGTGTAAQVPADLGTVKRVSGDRSTTCAIRTDDLAACWGNNDSGKASVPDDLGPVRQVEVGDSHACAIRLSDSKVRCWGGDWKGQATPPADLGPVSQIAVGGYYGCAIKLGGTVACWGMNASGQVTAPADLGTLKQITTGFYGASCGVRASGDPVCWADDGTTAGVLPEGVGPVKQVVSGAASTCAIKLDNTLTCWGLSDRTSVPSDVGEVRQVAVGWQHTCAVRLNGSLVCWGMSQPVADGATTPPASAFPTLVEGVVDFGDSAGLDFGDMLAGRRSSALRTFFTNSPLVPGAALKVKSAAITDSGSGAFSVLSQTCAGNSLADGATCSMRVRFAPKIWQRGELSGAITVTDDSAAGTHSIPLSGTAFEPTKFILQNPAAEGGYPGDTIPIRWETSDAAKVSITVAQPVTTKVKVKVGKKIVTKTVTTIKQLPVATNINAPAGPGTYNWVAKIAGKPATMGTWDMVISAVSARGTATVTGKLILWDPSD